MRTDPRIRRNLDHLSATIESTTDTVYTSCFNFTHTYITPCLSSLAACTTSCLPATPHPRRRSSHRPSDYPFGFYDYDDAYDPEPSPRDRLFAWSTDELDRLLAGTSSVPRAQTQMYYGATPRLTENTPDPTIIPSTHYFGFLGRLGFRGRGMRYKPSAANLQDQPHTRAIEAPASSSRKRSGTGSTSGGESFRSRRDLWPSEDEDDAVVIGDDAFPRSSDGESGASANLLLYDDEEEAEEGDVGEDGGVRKEWKEGRPVYTTRPHRSAPPTILASSPEPYMTTSPFAISPLGRQYAKSTANTIVEGEGALASSPRSLPLPAS